MKIKDWQKFQHFKDRRPLWIKLYRDILDKHDISLISDFAFRVLVGCWLLASEDEHKQGNLPDVESIAFRLRFPKSKIEKALQELEAFLIQDDINAISGVCQDDALEKEREREKEKSEKRAYGEFESVMLTDDEYQKLISKHGQAKALKGIEILDGYIASKGAKYKSHYAVFKADSWVWERFSEAASKQPAQQGFSAINPASVRPPQ
jgi:hypothetical protein